MNYYELVFDYWNKEEKHWVKSIAQKDMVGFNMYDLNKGIEMTQWNKNFAFSYNPREGKVFTDLLGDNLGWIIVSQRFKDIISMVELTNIQYLPIKVINTKTNEVNDNYSVVNLLKNVEAVDLENSVCRDDFKIYENGVIIGLIKPCINESKVGNRHIFRLKEDNVSVFVSQKLKDIIEESSLTGCCFRQVRVS